MVKVCPEDDEGYDDYKDYLSEDSDVGLSESAYRSKLKEVENPITVDVSIDKIVFVGNIPKVPLEKHEALKRALLQKLCRELQEKRQMEFDPSGVSIDLHVNPETKEGTGCGFMKFVSTFEAKRAARALKNTQIDKKHSLVTCMLDEFDRIISDEPLNSILFERDNLMWWLKTEKNRGLEQFVVRSKLLTEICWHDSVGRKPLLITNGEHTKKDPAREGIPSPAPVWTTGKVAWSPYGSYFMTFHKPGVALWGKPGFEKLVRFEHRDTEHALFSPNEEYIITYDGSRPGANNDEAVKIWRVTTHEMLRSLRAPICSCTGDNTWPYFAWSHDSAYLAARVHDDSGTIRIYSTPDITRMLDMTFELPKPQDMKTMSKTGETTASNLEFSWSPAANVLSVFIPEKGEIPSRVVLFEIPSKKELGSKNLYNVKEASVYWQSKGHYMALLTVIVKRTGKKGKKESTQIEIFRMKDKNCPVDYIQLEGLKVRKFAWETGGNRLAILVGDERNKYIRFYNVNHSGTIKDTQLVTTFDVSPCINTIIWSPTGCNFVIAAMGGDGTLVFASLTEQNKVDVYHTDDHFQVNEIMWDASGRYVCTAVALSLPPAASWRYSRDAGYQIWTFQGRLHHTFQSEDFYIFRWRPRPPSLLSPQKEREVHKTLKDFSRRFDEMDEALKREKRESFQLERKKIYDAFMEIVNEAREWSKSHKLCEEWEEAREDFEAQFSYEESVEKTEEVVESSTIQCH